MDKAHDIQEVTFSKEEMFLKVDGKAYTFNVSEISETLKRATLGQRNSFELSPTGYGIHWPELDEDLSIDGLIGAKHPHPFAGTKR